MISIWCKEHKNFIKKLHLLRHIISTLSLNRIGPKNLDKREGVLLKVFWSWRPAALPFFPSLYTGLQGKKSEYLRTVQIQKCKACPFCAEGKTDENYRYYHFEFRASGLQFFHRRKLKSIFDCAVWSRVEYNINIGNKDVAVVTQKFSPSIYNCCIRMEGKKS